MIHAKHHPVFLTVTCLNWIPILDDNRFKRILTDSFRHLVINKRVDIYAFVLMSNHFHLIWQVLEDNLYQDVQRDLLRYTSQQILKILRNENSNLLSKIEVNARDRKYQVWERNSLSISLWTPKVFEQKLEYIHNNPVKAGICSTPEGYHFSSSSFYELNNSPWEFLTHYEG
jgi:putative transposase